MPHAARLEDGDAALEATVDLHVFELDDVVGGERDAVARQLGRAEQVGDLHVHVERHARGAEVLGHGVDELLEPPLRGNAERHAGQAVEHGAPRAQPRHLLPRLVQEAVGRELDGRDVAEGEEPALLERAKVPAEALGDATELVRRLLEREVDARLSVPRALEQELQAEHRLAGPGPALDHRRARPRQAAAEHVVEPGDAGRGALVGRLRLGERAVRAAHARKEREPVAADLEEVTAGHEVGPAQLQDLDLADRAQLVAAVGEPDDAVGDRELREARDLLAACTRRRTRLAAPQLAMWTARS